MMRDNTKEAVLTLIASAAAIWFSMTVIPSLKIFIFGAIGLVGTPLFLSLTSALDGFKYEDSKRFVWSGIWAIASVAALIGVLTLVPDFGKRDRSSFSLIFMTASSVDECSGLFGASQRTMKV